MTSSFKDCFVCRTCELRAIRRHEQSIFWFIGIKLLSVKRKLLSCSPCSLSGWLASQCISLLRAWSLERYWFGIVRLLPSYIRYKKLRKLKLTQKYKWLLHEWYKNYPVFIVIIVYDCILFFVYFVLLTKSLKDTVTLQLWSFQEAAITIYFFKLQMLNLLFFLIFPSSITKSLIHS